MAVKSEPVSGGSIILENAETSRCVYLGGH